MTDHDAFTALVHPMGRPPDPTEADTAQATAWIDAWFARSDFCPLWKERNRADFIASHARKVMHDRLFAEYRDARNARKEAA